MSEELYFNNELRECLDAAVYSDCGENDQWNYWYQRLHKAHDAAVDSVTETQRAEIAKLRELVRDMWDFFCVLPDDPRTCKEELDFSIEVWRRMRELEVDDG